MTGNATWTSMTEFGLRSEQLEAAMIEYMVNRRQGMYE
jgi:hypothetical protein